MAGKISLWISVLCAVMTTGACTSNSHTAVSGRIDATPVHHANTDRIAIHPKHADQLGYTLAWAQNLDLPDDQSISQIAHLDKYIIVVEQPLSIVSALSRSDGSLLWQKIVGEKGELLSRPFLYENRICINSEIQMYQIDVRSGELAYAFRLYAPAAGDPLPAGDSVIFGGISGNVFSQNIRTGLLDWSYQLTNRINAMPLQHGNGIFVADTNGVYALIDIRNGNMLWRKRTFGPVTCSPAVSGDTILMASSDQSLYAIDPETGNDQWIFKTKYPLTHAPVPIDDWVYLNIPKQNLLYAIDKNTGETLWHHSDRGRPIKRVDNRILSAQNAALILMEPDTGRIQLEVPTHSLEQVVDLDNQSILLVTPEGQLLALTPRN